MNVIKCLRCPTTIASVFSKVFTPVNFNYYVGNVLARSQQSCKFSCFTNFKDSFNLNRLTLTPAKSNIIPSCGFKVRGKLQLRCKHCYYARVDGRMMVLCDSYPRHKQMALAPREKYTWILTHCFQSKKRPY